MQAILKSETELASLLHYVLAALIYVHVHYVYLTYLGFCHQQNVNMFYVIFE